MKDSILHDLNRAVGMAWIPGAKADNGTGAVAHGTYAKMAAHSADRAQREGRLTWAHGLEERASDALAHDAPAALRASLIKLAAFAIHWATRLDNELDTIKAEGRS